MAGVRGLASISPSIAAARDSEQVAGQRRGLNDKSRSGTGGPGIRFLSFERLAHGRRRWSCVARWGERGCGASPWGRVMAFQQPTTTSHVLFLRSDAAFWASALPKYAAGMQRLADRYAIASGMLSAVTGLGIWATIAASADARVQYLVSAVAFVAAVLALVPKQMGYADCASNCFDIAATYGKVEGDLATAAEKLAQNAPDALKAAEDARQRLEDVRARKEKLHPYPDKIQAEREQVLPDPFLPRLSVATAVGTHS